MALIPAGSFLMGRDDGSKDEASAHTVFLDAFYIDQYEVTNERYHFCALSGACKSAYVDTTSVPEKYYGTKYFEHPVVNVTWDMAAAYCQWRGARLPTEAEWEKAARGGLEKMLYPWGNTAPICDAGSRNGALFLDCANDKMTVKTGSYFANGYGLFDMAGNVWEWVFDAYSDNYYKETSTNAANPQGPVFVDMRVVRGGGWGDKGEAIQVANRGWAPPETQDNEIGFRCVKDATP
jgi:formylglycine-generating enzyme required for sulfatase activity